MKKVRLLFTASLLLSISVILSSSVPVTKAANTAVAEAPVASTENGAKKAALSAPLTYQELKAIATQVKGSKLTFKERIGIKFFGKKIASKLSKAASSGGGKSQIVALLLCIFVGGLGIHRFYLGYTWQGIVQLLTGGGCGIWALIDLIRIITGDLQPKDSNYDVTL